MEGRKPSSVAERGLPLYGRREEKIPFVPRSRL